MSNTTALMQMIEFADAGAIVRITTHKLFEHESMLLVEELRAYFDQSGRNLIAVNFEKVEFISSAALGAMVSINTELAKRGGHLVVCHLNAEAMQVIKLTKLDKLIPVEKDEKKAQKRLQK